MKNEDINCYRINYAKSWRKHCDPNGWVTLPYGVVEAIHWLCDEVEMLRDKNHKLYRDKQNLRRKLK